MSDAPAPIIDAVIHAYNFASGNFRNRLAESFARGCYKMINLTGDAGLMPEDRYFKDWSIEELARLVFVESEVDLAVFHGVPLDDYFHDGLVSNDKGIEMSTKWPDRVMFYAAVNPLLGAEAVERAEHYVRNCGARGIKIYPERYLGQGRRQPVELDDPGHRPLMEKAMELGVPVAVHKFAPGSSPTYDNFHSGDVRGAAAAYPELQIEVVHSGMAFVAEIAAVLADHPNVWANLEGTTALAVQQPEVFGEALATMLAAAPDRVIFSSGACLVHPQPILDALRTFTLSDDLIKRTGSPALTDDVRAGIMGGNYGRLHRLDWPSLRAAIDGDEFARARASRTLPRWSDA